MLTLEYRLTGAGWAECVIHADGRSITATASYLSDALGNLASAVVAMSAGEMQSGCSFDEEPGEYRWLFSREGEHVLIRILWFDEFRSGRSDVQGEDLFQAKTTVRELVEAVSSVLEAVLEKHGIDGYREEWREDVDFPLEQLNQLQAVIRGNKTTDGV